jgi:hypothetical protein
MPTCLRYPATKLSINAQIKIELDRLLPHLLVSLSVLVGVARSRCPMLNTVAVSPFMAQ